MPQRVPFPDSAAVSDVLTYSARTASLGDGAVRLRAAGGVLTLSSAPLAPRGLLDPTPTIVGMRALSVDGELECDLVVEAASLGRADDDEAALELPETAVSAAWAGIAPPRGGWTETGAIPAATLAERAQWGIAAVAEAMPETPGEDVVRSVRASIWGVPDDALGGLPLGAAFAAFALGFIAGEELARTFTAPGWTRLSLARGHVLVRGPVKTGLTDVRATGRG